MLTKINAAKHTQIYDSKQSKRMYHEKAYNIPHMEIQCLVKMQQKWELQNKFLFKKSNNLYKKKLKKEEQK